MSAPVRYAAPPLERDRELELVASLLDSARAGQGRLAFIVADAGLGKTTLLREAAVAAREQGVSVFTARGAELEREIPFGLTRQLLGRIHGALTSGQLDALRAGAAALALSLLEGSEPIPGDAGGLLHGLYWFLTTICEQQPALLGLDDLHWCDAETLRFLAYLAPRISALPLLVLCSARQAEPGAAPALRTVITDQDAARITLKPLSVTASSELVARQLGAGAAPEWVQASHRMTGGNPFLLGELVESVREHRVPLTIEGATVIGNTTTARTRETIAARLEQAGPGAETVAAATAVLGGDAELRRVAELANLTIGAAQDATDRLVGISILHDGRPLEFVHPLVRSAVYGRLSARRRDKLHRRAAAILRKDGASAVEVAAHAFPLEPAGDASLVAALTDAAREAQNTGAPDAAARYLRRALAEPPPAQQRAELWFALGRALAATDAHAAAAALARAAETGDAELSISALRWQGATLGFGGQPAAAVAALNRALTSARDDEEDVLIRATRDFYALSWLDDPAAQERADRVVADAERASVQSPGGRRLVALASWIVAATGNGTAAQALKLGHRARNAQGAWLAEDDGVETAASFGESSIIVEEAPALERHERALVATRERGMVVFGATAMVQIADIRFRRGELLRAEVDARTAWRLLGPEGERNVIFHRWSLAALIAVLVARGEVTEADQLATATSAWTMADDQVGLFPFAPLLPVALGELALAAGRREDGIARLQRAGERLEAHGWHNPALNPWRARIVPALVMAGRSAEAREVIAPAVQQARRFGTPWALGMALRAAGTAEDGERRFTLLEEAVAVLQDGGCQVEHAHARLELGATLRRRNRRTEGREHLRVALDMGVRSGAATIAARARQEIAASGARLRREVLSGLESLTASELRVAELAAEGHSNPEIAQELFVSRKTVEAHLHRTYMKLDIRSREELPRSLAPAL